MDASNSIPNPDDAGEYRRQARHIRAIHRGDPVKTQQALKELIAIRLPGPEVIEFSPSQQPKIDWSTSAVLGHRTPAARLFADQVAERLLGSMLPFSARQELLVIAEMHGINRFEANLIIATVQNRVGTSAPPEDPERRPKIRLSFPLAALVAAEVLVVAALWRIFL